MNKPLSLYGSALSAPLNQIYTVSNPLGVSLIHTKHRNQAKSETKSCIVGRLMHDRWWSNCARFIKKAVKSCQINRTHPRPLADLTITACSGRLPDLPCIGFKEKGGTVEKRK